MAAEFEIKTKGKGLFLSLSAFSLLLMMILTTLLWWFISPRLHEISNFVANLSLTALRFFYLVLLSGTILVFLTSYLEKNFLVAKFAVRTFIKVLFPVTLFISNLLGFSKEKVSESFVFVNNSFLKSMKKNFKASDIVILLPHCLQNHECKIRITTNIKNCKKCGRCDIGDLCKLAEKYAVNMYIATGGTLARKIVVEHRPKLIIAVACHRDLVSGMRDVFPIPVYGVLNRRPNGPCFDTEVDVEKIDIALKGLIV